MYSHVMMLRKHDLTNIYLEQHISKARFIKYHAICELILCFGFHIISTQLIFNIFARLNTYELGM